MLANDDDDDNDELMQRQSRQRVLFGEGQTCDFQKAHPADVSHSSHRLAARIHLDRMNVCLSLLC